MQMTLTLAGRAYCFTERSFYHRCNSYSAGDASVGRPDHYVAITRIQKELTIAIRCELSFEISSGFSCSGRKSARSAFSVCVYVGRNDQRSARSAYAGQFIQCLQRIIEKMDNVSGNDLVEFVIGIGKISDISGQKGNILKSSTVLLGFFQHPLREVGSCEPSASGSDHCA